MLTRPTAIWALLAAGWLVASGLVPLSSRAQAPLADWPVTEGAPGGGRHSPLVEITPGNVSRLRVAWTYRHGDFWKGSFPLPIHRGSAFESTPIVVEGRLFFTTLNASSEVFRVQESSAPAIPRDRGASTEIDDSLSMESPR